MSLKKWLTGLVAAIVVMTTLGSMGVFAEGDAATQPAEQAITVEMHDDYFNPKVITIPKGTTTTLKLINKGVKEHTFTVAKLGIDVDVEPGKEATITVKPQTAGTYELICRYHVKQGMVGQVIVQ